MANQIVVRLPKIAADEQVTYADQAADDVYYILPLGYVVTSVYTPLRSGLSRYIGSVGALSTDCGVTLPDPAPVTGGPAWVGDPSLPNLIPGTSYEFFLPFIVGTAATGQAITDIIAISKPNWLSVTKESTGVRLVGPAPSDAENTALTLALKQTDGKTTPRNFIIQKGAGGTSFAVFAYAKYVAATKNLELRTSPNSPTAPLVSIISGPSTFTDRASYPMTQFETGPLPTIKYYFVFTHYTGIPDGTYTIKFVYPLRTVYAQVTVGSTNLEQALTLSDTAPTAPANNMSVIGPDVCPSGSTRRYAALDAGSGDIVWTVSAFSGVSLVEQPEGGAVLTNNSTVAGSVTVYATQNGFTASKIVQITAADGTPSGNISQVRLSAEKIAQSGGDQLSINLRIKSTLTIQAALLYAGASESGRVYADITFPDPATVPGGLGEMLHIKSLPFQSGVKVRIWFRNKATSQDVLVVESLTAVPTGGSIPYTIIYPVSAGPIDSSDQAGETDSEFFTGS